jgi:hypothetical protein
MTIWLYSPQCLNVAIMTLHSALPKQQASPLFVIRTV